MFIKSRHFNADVYELAVIPGCRCSDRTGGRPAQHWPRSAPPRPAVHQTLSHQYQYHSSILNKQQSSFAFCSLNRHKTHRQYGEEYNNTLTRIYHQEGWKRDNHNVSIHQSVTRPGPPTAAVSAAALLAATAAASRASPWLGWRGLGPQLYNTVRAAGGETLGKEGLVLVPVIVAVGQVRPNGQPACRKKVL